MSLWIHPCFVIDFRGSCHLKRNSAQFRSVFQSVTHSDLFVSPPTSPHTVLQVRSHTGARGTAAIGASLVRMSWRVITGSTRAPNPSSAPSARVPFPDPTTSPCTWKDTRTSSVCAHAHITHTSTVLTHTKHSLLSPTTTLLQAARCRATFHCHHSSSWCCYHVLEPVW